MTTCIEVQEYRHDSDMVFITFAAPTLNPTVVIQCPIVLCPVVTFDHRTKHVDSIKKADGVWQPEGLLLPHQTIRVRLYPKDKSTAFLSAG